MSAITSVQWALAALGFLLGLASVGLGLCRWRARIPNPLPLSLSRLGETAVVYSIYVALRLLYLETTCLFWGRGSVHYTLPKTVRPDPIWFLLGWALLSIMCWRWFRLPQLPVTQKPPVAKLAILLPLSLISIFTIMLSGIFTLVSILGTVLGNAEANILDMDHLLLNVLPGYPSPVPAGVIFCTFYAWLQLGDKFVLPWSKGLKLSCLASAMIGFRLIALLYLT